jgi:hypothetical protein
MRNFTDNDVIYNPKYNYYYIDNAELIHKPLWFHKMGLMQTATGFGKKLKTEYMIKLNNRLYRVYCRLFSNSGTCYIKTRKGNIAISP